MPAPPIGPGAPGPNPPPVSCEVSETIPNQSDKPDPDDLADPDETE